MRTVKSAHEVDCGVYRAEAGFDEAHMAYVRAVKSEDVCTMFPDAPQLMPGLQLFMLLDADGSPLLLTDDEKTAFSNARDYDLQTVSLH